MNTTSPSGQRGRTALSVITAGIASGAVLVSMAFAIDALSTDAHGPTADTATYASTLQPDTPNLVYNGD